MSQKLPVKKITVPQNAYTQKIVTLYQIFSWIDQCLISYFARPCAMEFYLRARFKQPL